MGSTAALRADAVSDWEACADAFYCEEHLYDLAWPDVDLGAQRVAAAPFGGPIALVRDEQALVVVRAGAAAGGRPVVRLFSCAGQLLGSFLWEGARLADWGWSSELELVTVDVGGKVALFSQAGTRLPKQVGFGPELEAEGVARVCLYSDGLVVQAAASNTLWAVVGLQEPRATRLPAIPGLAPGPGAGAGSSRLPGGGAPAPGAPGQAGSTVSCMAVLEPRFTLSSGLEVLVAAGEAVWVVDDHGATDQPLPPGCGGVSAMAVSPNGAFLALACRDGVLRVLASDFSQQLSEFDTRSNLPPSALAWCGVDAVALRWQALLLLVGPYGDWLKRAAAGPLAMVPEVDGLRLLSNSVARLLRRVPDVLVQLYKPGSTSPLAQLLDARDLFDAGSARADKLLRQLGGQLQAAVEGCAAAAGLELCVPRQKALLRAAVFGRAFAPGVSPGLLRDTALKLRVLNALRQPGVGVPLTMPQLEALTLPVVVSRLVLGRHHLLAYRIAEALGGAGREDVLLHWAAAKITASPSVPDAQLKDEVMAKMARLARAKYAPLAAHAQALGRRSLAIRLLEEEPSAAQQVPLLISLSRSTHAAQPGGGGGAGSSELEGGEDTLGRALRKAVEAGDPDLVYLALFAAYRSRPLPEFWKLVAARATARNLFVRYTRLKEPELLETLFVTQGLSAEAGELALQTSLRQLAGVVTQAGPRQDDAGASRAVAGLQEAAQKFGQSRETAWQARAAGEAAQLLREQLRLERDTGQALFVGLSLSDTLTTCLRLGHAKAAASLRKAFAVPEGRWYWTKLNALACAHDWDALELWAAERRSPIGWEAFVAAAERHGAPREVVSRLAARLPEEGPSASAWKLPAMPGVADFGDLLRRR